MEKRFRNRFHNWRGTLADAAPMLTLIACMTVIFVAIICLVF